MNVTDRREKQSLWVPVLLVAGLSLFHAINNWIWLSKNVMTRGWDRIGSLINSLYYYDTLTPLTWQAFFRASVQDEFRPPLFGFSMAWMYKLFGVEADVAVLVNVLYMAVLLAACYALGARLGGRRLGALSAVLAALIPLVFAMSRYSYFEFSLTALVATSVALLLASDGFQNRPASLLLGVALGLGLLIKRTFPVFVVGALAVVFFQAGLPRRLWARLRAGPRPRWRDVGLALGGGLLLAALWFFPNRAAAEALLPGLWLFGLWAALVALAIFFPLQLSSPETNFLGSLSVAAALASIWYLPHGLEFLNQILWLAWGIEDPRGRTVDFTSLSTYTDYLSSILYGFSPVFTLLLLLAAGLLLAYWLWRRQRPWPRPWWRSGWWGVLAALAVAYLVLSTSIYKEHRAITPALPLLGVVLGGALLKLPWRRLGLVLVVLAVAFGLVQFFAISYTEPHNLLVETTYLPRPILGQWSVFAQGLYLELPDSGSNDPAYYIAGDVLQHVEMARQREGWETISLGIIAYSSHVNVGLFAYDQMLAYPNVQLEDPTQSYPMESAYSTAFRYDYVLVLKNKNRRPAVREGERLILEERRAFFEQGFEEEARYPLPDGSEAYLFRRRFRPMQTHDPTSLYQTAEHLRALAEPEDVVVVQPPGLLVEVLAYYWGPARISSLAEVGGPSSSSGVVLVKDGAENDSATLLAEKYGSPVHTQSFGDIEIAVFSP